MISFGIDVASVKAGWGFIDTDTNEVQYGLIKAPASQPLENRLLFLYNALTEILDNLEQLPDTVFIEDQFHHKNTKTLKALSQARGVAVLTVMQREIPIGFIEATKAKLAIAGKGKASKELVTKSVIERFHVADDIQEDEADALAIAYAGLSQLEEV